MDSRAQISLARDAAKAMSADKRIARLAAIEKSAFDALIEKAAIITEHVEAGGDREALPYTQDVVEWLLRIGYGQVSPETFLAYSHREPLLRRIASLDWDLQLRLTGPQARLKVWVVGDGGYTDRMLHPNDLPENLYGQVFNRDSLRTDAEQVAYLDSIAARNAIADIGVEDGIVPGRDGFTAKTETGCVFVSWKQYDQLLPIREKYRKRRKSAG